MHIPSFARSILQGFLVFAALVCVIFLAILTINFTFRRRAEKLLEDIRTLRPGQSTRADVERIMWQHGGGPSGATASFCSPSDGAYGVWVGSQTLNRIGRSAPLLRYLGLRQWGTTGTVILREGQVCFVQYAVGMAGPIGKLDWNIDTELLPDEDIDISMGQPARYKVNTRDYKGVRRVHSELTPKATAEERRRAFTYDFSCLTSMRGCQQPCEFSPLVWQDIYLQSLQSGYALPAEEMNAVECKVRVASH